MNINDYKWLISSGLTSKSVKEEEVAWNEYHENYSGNVFSLTQDPKVCETLIFPNNQFSGSNIPDSPEIQVLIPGCGSEIYLQKTLFEFCPNIGQIFCTDFSKTAIDLAKKKWQEADGDARIKSQQLIFEQVDSTKIITQKPDWKNKFDYILSVASVVSGEDAINRQMLREFYKVLKPGGKLYGLFPTIFLQLEIAHLYLAKSHWITDGTINIPDSSCYQKEHNERQIFYTPLRLNRIFKEIGFKRLSFEINFGDSDILLNAGKELEAIDDPDICSWVFLVRLEK